MQNINFTRGFVRIQQNNSIASYDADSIIKVKSASVKKENDAVELLTNTGEKIRLFDCQNADAITEKINTARTTESIIDLLA